MIFAIRLSEIPDPEQMPLSILTDWLIAEAGGEYFFAGIASDSGKLRLSTPIVELDAAKARGRTRSGRVYELAGAPMPEEARRNACAVFFQGSDATAQAGLAQAMPGPGH